MNQYNESNLFFGLENMDMLDAIAAGKITPREGEYGSNYEGGLEAELERLNEADRYKGEATLIALECVNANRAYEEIAKGTDIVTAFRMYGFEAEDGKDPKVILKNFQTSGRLIASISKTLFKYIKSDTNPESADSTDEILKNFIMKLPDDLDYNGLLKHVFELTDTNIKNIESADYVLNKNTKLKIKEDSRYGDYRSKAVRLWNMMADEENQIRIPGTFGCIRIKLNKELLDIIKKDYTKVYETFIKFSTDIFRFKITTRIIDIAEIYFGEDQELIDSKLGKYLAEIDDKSKESI